jgi:hypothetical protein
VGSDTTAFDGTVNGASFIENGGVRDVVSGANSGAYNFDGVDDLIRVNGDTDLNVDSISFGQWVQLDDNAFKNFSGPLRSILARDDNLGERIYKCALTDDSFRVEIFTSSSRVLSPTISVPVSQPLHLFVTYDSASGDFRSFLNGQEIAAQTSVSGPLRSHTQPLDIGAPAELADNRFFKGVIDDVRIYNRALSASEINQIYQNTDPQ